MKLIKIGATFAVGLLAAFLLRNRDPEPARKRYSWEREDAGDDDYDWPGDW